MHSSLVVIFVSGKGMCQEKWGLQKIRGLLPTNARDDNTKGAAISSVTSQGAGYVKT
jgi:hypothetical protein